MRLGLRTTVLIATLALFLTGVTAFREPIAAAAQKAAEVFITNDAANPVPVKEQARVSPVQVTLFATFSNGGRFSTTETLYTVPAGKVLVIESFSGGSNMDPADHLMDIQFSATYGGFIPYVVAVHPEDEGVFTQTNARIFRGTLAASAYAGPGTTVTAFGTRDGASLSGTALRVAISGRLIDAP
jgi:hypothetical protein